MQNEITLCHIVIGISVVNVVLNPEI